MAIDQVRSHFEREAFDYDGLISRLIPYYNEQNELLLKLIPFERSAPIKVLDLGTGTGILAYYILREFPNAKVVAFDLADKMLEMCRKNLADFQGRTTFRQGDFAEDEIGKGYDLIVSGLSLHHLDDEGKKKFFHKLNSAINPAGVFLNRDIVKGSTPKLNAYYEKLWREFIKSNGEDDGHWFNKYLEEDIPATVEEQLHWLTEAGFQEVACHWRYLNYAIFGGQKL